MITRLLQKLKVQTRLYISFGFVILLTILIAVGGLTGMDQSRRGMSSFINGYYEAALSVKNSRAELEYAGRLLRDAYITGSTTEAKNEVPQIITQVQADIDAVRELNILDNALLEQYKTAINTWSEIGTRALKALESGNETSARRILTQECTPALARVDTLAQQIGDDTDAIARGSLTETLAALNVLIVALMVEVALAIIASIFLAGKITHSVVDPLHEVDAAVQDMSRGVLTTPVTYHGADVTGDLAHSLRSSQAKLSGYIKDIDRAMAEMSRGNFDIEMENKFVGDFENIEASITHFTGAMSAMITDMREVADSVTSSSTELANSSQSLSQGATEQAAAITELATTMDHVADRVRKNTQNAGEASMKLEHTSEQLTASNEQMRALTEAMARIEESSQKIGNIIKTIEDIAFQTNILALNAAVEAARAGAAGKGFAVVADEVRSLANKSGEASASTTQLIEGSVAAVREGTALADETAKSLAGAVSSASEVVEAVNNISIASSEQSTAITQVTQGIDEISNVVQTNSAASEESAVASTELADQSEKLRALIAHFRAKQH